MVEPKELHSVDEMVMKSAVYSVALKEQMSAEYLVVATAWMKVEKWVSWSVEWKVER
jgi:hypothetical protein